MDTTHAVFTYGTLMTGSIMQSVTGRRFQGIEATLHGFARYSVRDETYPGIIEDAESSVAGILYTGVDEISLGRLDRFEGDMYRRIAVEVVDCRGAHRTAFAYLVRDSHRHMLTQEPWDPDSFRKSGMRGFLNGYKGFRDIE